VHFVGGLFGYIVRITGRKVCLPGLAVSTIMLA
jgi:hypothetical protein